MKIVQLYNSRMRIVVDTSAVLAVLIHEPRRDALLATTEGAELVAPGSLRWELGNALTAMFKRRRLQVHEAQKVLDEFGRVPIRLVDVPLPDAVGLADELGMYAYDAYMLVCAMQTRAPLLTLDRSLAAAAAVQGIRVLEV